MKPLRIVEGAVIPVDRADVDTDQIIPARHLKRIDREGLGRHAFEAWRGQPGNPFDEGRFAGAPILLTGPNFGCGSSREHAPWALADLGIRVIVAPSFADIFRNNCAKVGILTVALGEDVVAPMMARAKSQAGLSARVDLAAQRIEDGQGRVVAFEVDPFVKRCLLEGLDAIALSLAHADAIAVHERARPGHLPVTREAP
jgi:3-isopropylmalate/(R)-2-methylmalate dehydratase small subunit